MISITVPVERASYMAAAVIQHWGADNKGHYVTLVRQSTWPRSQWWLCNDSVVSTVSWANITVDAVAVLYRRVPSAS